MAHSPEVPGSAISFSLSHSQSFAVVAVADSARVGVDIEVIRPRARLDALAKRVLSPAEHADWLDYPPTARLRAFLERWTAKEAYLKAILKLQDAGLEMAQNIRRSHCSQYVGMSPGLLDDRISVHLGR